MVFTSNFIISENQFRSVVVIFYTPLNSKLLTKPLCGKCKHSLLPAAGIDPESRGVGIQNSTRLFTK